MQFLINDFAIVAVNKETKDITVLGEGNFLVVFAVQPVWINFVVEFAEGRRASTIFGVSCPVSESRCQRRCWHDCFVVVLVVLSRMSWRVLLMDGLGFLCH
jgi:hypothetical protein